jgi:putative membrane-bound dehydrogenase-like protein
MRKAVWTLPTLFVATTLGAQDGTVGPLAPKDALRTFKVAEGFRVDLVAAEPDTLDPVAFAFDEDGRLYVAEMADYPLGPPSGRIRRLEDTDGDGRVDRSTLFVEKVGYPKGVMPWRGGVLVPAAPDIFFFKDTDGDGKADVREVVFTGFAEGNQQHRVNGLQFGLDNWIYGANGDSGGNIRRGDQPDARRVSIRGTDFRFRPDYSGFEPVAGHAQFANTFDDWGNRFINNNSNHVIQPILPLHYLARNPHFSASSVQDMISDHGAAAKVFPISALQQRPNDPGAAGNFTSACSVTIYRGGAFPEEYRGNAFVCEPVHNLVHRDVLVPRGGAAFAARRAVEGAEFLASTDNWFRPVNLQVGPDGALYVVDMYRAVIEHPQWIPLELQKRWDLRAGSDRGRIYRVAPEGLKGVRPRLGSATAAELVAALEHPNAWWRTTAQRLLVERREKGASEALRALARESRLPQARLHALWTLQGLDALDDGQIARALGDSEPWVRVHGLRLAEPRLAASAPLRDAVAALRRDDSPHVRFQLAFTLGELREDRALDGLAGLLVRDGEDRWLRAAVLSSIPGGAARLLARLRATAPDYLEKPAPGALDALRQLAELAGASRREEQVVEWLRIVAGDAEGAPARWRLVALSALGPSLRRWGVGLEGLLGKSGTASKVSEWTARLADTAADGARDVPERVNAIDLLALLPTSETAARLERLIRPQEPQEVQAAVVRALFAAPGNPAAARLLDGWTRYTGAVRRELLAQAFARPDQVGPLLERLEKGEIRVVELEPHHRDALLKNPSGAVRERARKLFESKGSREIETMIEGLYAKVGALKGDAAQGEKVYMSNCASCHRLHGQGFEVGPSLSSVAGRDKRALLTDILNPNRAVAPQYQVYVVKTPTQEMVSGVISAETPTSLTLRRAAGEQTTILRRDIVEIKAWPASMMPEGLENNITPQGFADLLEFLAAGGPKPAPKAFDGNRPGTVKPAGDGTLVLAAARAEIYGSTLVFEAKYGNLGYWSSENDRAAWTLEVPAAGKYAVEIDWACENGTAGNAWTLEAGGARLNGKVEGTGTWDAYRQARVGVLELKAGSQRVTFRSAGAIRGALIDLRTIRLTPVKE